MVSYLISPRDSELSALQLLRRTTPRFGPASLQRRAIEAGPYLVHTIVLATQKGGSGKTTLAIGLALAAMQAGYSVRMIDTDNQRTLSNWQVRRGIAEPVVEFVRGTDNIEHRLAAFDRRGVDLTIIDTASGMGEVAMAAIRSCDLCLIPTRPTVLDIEATAATLNIVRRWRRPFAFILNQAPARGQRVGGAADTLGALTSDLSEILAQPFVAMRNDHQDALAAGIAVTEYAPSGKSADEIRGLWRWTQARLTAAPACERGRVEIPAGIGEPPADTLGQRSAFAGDNSLAWDAGL